MRLGDLEFKAEHFAPPSPGIHIEHIPMWAADRANQILREKLAKAPELFQGVPGFPWDKLENWKVSPLLSGRLVCIEPTK